MRHHVPTILTDYPKLGVRRARAVDTRSSIGVWLLAWTACRAGLVILAHDVRRHAVLTHSDRGIRRSSAANTLCSILVGTSACRACSASGRAIALGIRDKWSLAWLARRRANTRELSGQACRTFCVVKSTSLSCVAWYAEKTLVVRKSNKSRRADAPRWAQLALRVGLAGIRGVAWARKTSNRNGVVF